MLHNNLEQDWFHGTLLPGVSSLTKIKVYLVILALIVLSAPLSSALAEDAPSPEKEKIGRKIKMQELNVVRLKEGLKQEKKAIKQATEEEEGLLAKLESINMKLQEQQNKLDTLKQQMVNQKELIRAKENELKEFKKKKGAIQDHLKKRISSYYKLDKVSLINITFSAETLPDILNFHDSFEKLLTYDQHIVQSYRDSIDELNRAREALTLEEGLLHEFILRGNKEKAAIELSKQDLETLITHIRTQSSLHKQAIAEIEEEARKLTSYLETLKEKEEKLDQEFLLSKGTLPLPVEGKIITLFNEMTTNQLGISKKSNGISIAAKDGAPVKAIFKGNVLYAGYLRGHGNTIVVHHGHQYYSIISRVEKILIKKGETVKQGTLLAAAGDTAMIIDDGIQLEIRHERNKHDPLSWVDLDKVTFDKYLKNRPLQE